jgi:hypothetical protein
MVSLVQPFANMFRRNP